MRRIVPTLLAFGVLLGLALASRADADDEASAIIDKAIKAHKVKLKGAKNWAYRGKNKGTLHVLGMKLAITQEVSVQMPDKFKEVLDMTIMGQKVTVTTVFNGKQAWIKANDKEIKVEKELLDELKEVTYFMRLSQAMFLKDKSLKLSLLGEVQVNGKPALGVKVAKEGKKDINFYFDKATGLMAKTERRTRDFMTGQETTEERIITKYHDVDGQKMAKKVQVNRDGKKFLDAEVIEGKVLDRLDDDEFAQP